MFFQILQKILGLFIKLSALFFQRLIIFHRVWEHYGAGFLEYITHYGEQIYEDNYKNYETNACC